MVCFFFQLRIFISETRLPHIYIYTLIQIAVQNYQMVTSFDTKI